MLATTPDPPPMLLPQLCAHVEELRRLVAAAQAQGGALGDVLLDEYGPMLERAQAELARREAAS